MPLLGLPSVSALRRGLGVPDGAFLLQFLKALAPPLLLLSSFSFFFLLPFLFFPPMHFVLATSPAGPFGPCGQGGRRGWRPAESVLGRPALFRGPFPHPPWAAVPSVPTEDPWYSHGSPSSGGQGLRPSGRVWVCFLRQAQGKVPLSLIHCTFSWGPIRPWSARPP